MFLIGLRRSGNVYQRFLLAKIFVFALQVLLPLRRCPIYTSAFFGSIAPLVFPSSLSLPSEGRDGEWWSRDALVLLPEGFPLLPLDFGPAGGVAEPLVARSVHGSSLLSPRVHSWTRDSGVALLRRTPSTFSVPVGSPSSTLRARQGVGEGEFSGGFSMFSVASPASSLHAWRGGGAGESSEYRSG